MSIHSFVFVARIVPPATDNPGANGGDRQQRDRERPGESRAGGRQPEARQGLVRRDPGEPVGPDVPTAEIVTEAVCRTNVRFPHKDKTPPELDAK
jgi:hypothetical protein